MAQVIALCCLAMGAFVLLFWGKEGVVGRIVGGAFIVLGGFLYWTNRGAGALESDSFAQSISNWWRN